MRAKTPVRFLVPVAWVFLTAGLVVAEKSPPLPDLRPIERGQVLPDAKFIDETGRSFELKNYRGHALAVNFIYSRCPLPNMCPMLNTQFRETQRLLVANPKTPKNWQLLSITIDPERDTPEALAGLAKALKADPARWRFGTGTLKDITSFALRCGLNFWEKDGVIEHNLRTLVIEPSGKVRQVYADNAWKPKELAAEISAAAVER